MSMYGTYWGFSLPLSTLAALVASRPSVSPAASITYHLRLTSLPLGIKVDMSLQSLKTQSSRKTRSPTPKKRGPSKFCPLPNNSVRVRSCRESALEVCLRKSVPEAPLQPGLWPRQTRKSDPAAYRLPRQNPFRVSRRPVRVGTHRPQAQHRARSLE